MSENASARVASWTRVSRGGEPCPDCNQPADALIIVSTVTIERASASEQFVLGTVRCLACGFVSAGEIITSWEVSTLS